MASVEGVMMWLELMTNSTTGDSRLSLTTDDLRLTIKKSFSERVDQVVELALDSHVDLSMEEEHDPDVCKRYLKLLLQVLTRLNEIIEENTKHFLECTTTKESLGEIRRTEHTVPQLSPDVLSVGHQAVLGKVYQFVVTLGIIPHLFAGVGVPIASRSRFGNLLSSLVTRNETDLRSNMEEILKVTKPANVRSIFMARHLGDLLAALMQLSHSKSSKRPNNQSKQIIPDSQSKQTIPNSQPQQSIPGSQSEQTMSVNQSKQAIPDNQSKETVPSIHSQKSIPGSQSEQTISVNQSKQAIPDNQSAQTLPGSQSTQIMPNDNLTAAISSQKSQPETGTSVTSDQTNNCLRFHKALDELMTKSYPPLIVRELLLLQGGGAGIKAPVWLRAVCGHYLTKILVSSQGVKSIIGGMITSDTDDWQKFRMVGGVIATPPRDWTVDKYYQLIAPQVISLLSEADEVVSRQYGRVCAAVLSAVGSKYPQLMQSLFWLPLTADLDSRCLTRQEAGLKALYKVICCAAEPQSLLLTYCLQILPEIFNIYLQCKNKVIVTDARLCSEEIISTCLAYSDSQSVSCFLHDITFNLESHDLGAEELEAEDERSTAILFCISKVADSDVLERFFVALLEKLTSLLITDSSTGSADPDIAGSHLSISLMITKLRVMSLLASLCETQTKICLKHPHYVIRFVKSSLEHTLSVVRSDAASSAAYSMDTETLSLSLGLLTALMSGATDVKLSEGDVKLLNELSEPLNSLSLLACVPTDTRELALNIRVAIATQGLVWLSNDPVVAKQPKIPAQAKITLIEAVNTNSTEQSSPTEDGEKDKLTIKHTRDLQSQQVSGLNAAEFKKRGYSDLRKALNPLDHKTNDTSQQVALESAQVQTCDTSKNVSDFDSNRNMAGHNSREEEVPGRNRYKEAMLELSDHLIPVKGHALIQLTRLIQSKDKTTIENRHCLLDLLIQHLAHSDSYIYLSAISALVALADKYPAEVLPAVCEQYGNVNIASETRLKIGEVITKVTRCLGDMAPAHSDLILSTVLIGCRAVDEMLRSSALANLGELCKLLQYSMSHHVHEIAECLSASLIGSSQSSRKGSAYSVSLILSGLDKRSFDVLGVESVKKLYRALRTCVHSENDDITTHHCAVAIATLDRVVKSSMFSNDSNRLEKRIFVLDPPT